MICERLYNEHVRFRERLYKAKAEYYEQKLGFAVSLLIDALNADDEQCNFLGSRLYDQIEEFIGEVLDE